jgi:hypothetical protein
MVSYYFFKEPRIKDLPQFDLPDPASDTDFYGEVWIRYPLDQAVFPTHFGHVFKACIQLRAILNTMAIELFSEGRTQAKLSLEQAYDFHARLDTWYRELPDVLSATAIVLPNHLKVQ